MKSILLIFWTKMSFRLHKKADYHQQHLNLWQFSEKLVWIVTKNFQTIWLESKVEVWPHSSSCASSVLHPASVVQKRIFPKPKRLQSGMSFTSDSLIFLVSEFFWSNRCRWCCFLFFKYISQMFVDPNADFRNDAWKTPFVFFAGARLQH